MVTTGTLPGEEEVLQVLDRDGRVHDDATIPDLDREELLTIFEQLCFARRLDERAVSLHRQGRMGTYPPLAGQEAAQIASTHALADDDWLSYQYREHGAVVARGMSEEYLCYWMGNEVGNEWLHDKHVFPVNISIGSQVPHATGLAWAAKLRGDDRVTICHFGDGATSEGDFHEGMNFAGVFDVPAVFFCNNNQWAISVPRGAQTASPTIATKAHAYGFEGVRVDGMDPLAVYAVTREAVEHARDPERVGRAFGLAGEGTDSVAGIDGDLRPTLIEAVMYRLGAHTTVDDPAVYRDPEELERWQVYDPIERFEAFLRNRDVLDDGTRDEIDNRVAAGVDELVDRAEAFVPDPDRMFEHVYGEQTPRVRRQQAELRALRERHGDDELVREE